MTGCRPRVVLVHGDTALGPLAWMPQWPLRSDVSLVAVTRHGFGERAGRPPDLAADEALVIDALEDGAHLVGHSRGALIALAAAAGRPAAVRSLVLVEPPLFSLVRGDAAVDALVSELDRPAGSRAGALRALLGRVGVDPRVLVDDAVEQLPPSWTFELPAAADRLDAPVVVVSGGWHDAFERVADALARRLRARRVVLDAGHHAPQASLAFNALLAGVVSGSGVEQRRHLP